MNHLDAHGLLKQALLRGNHGARKSGDKLAFRCVRHADSTQSAWMGTHAWGCSACGFTEGLRTLADSLGVDLPVESGKGSHGLTVAEYAERKGLALDKLTSYGVEDRTGKFGEALVAIPYKAADGSVLRTKLRTRSKTFWDRDGEGCPLYGLDRLASSTGPVLIVEGESDCHAAWQRGVAAIGVPGASQWKLEYGTLFTGRDVVVWQEPDEGGATLVAAIAKSLPKAKVVRDVRVGDTAVKDFGDLHQAVQQLGTFWAPTWRAILDTATPIGAEPPVVAFDSITGDTLDAMMAEKLEPISAIATMLPQWNASCKGRGGGVGLARGWMVTIGGRPGYGKTQTALNVASSAIRQGKTVAFVSLEMGRSDLGTSLMAITSGESVVSLEQGESFDPAVFRRAASYMNDVRATMGGHMLVNRRPLHKWRDVESAIKYLVEFDGADMVLMDYIQLAHVENAVKKEAAVEHASNGFRRLVDDLRIVGVALSQFNRETSKARDERPQAQGLMGSSSIENDSHQVVLIDHSRHERTGNLADTWLILDKNRHGPVLDLPVQWDYRTLRLHPRDPAAAVQLRPTEPLRKHSAGMKRPEPLPYKEPEDDTSLPF